jgi:Alpha/beta hydrolase family
MRRTAVLVHGAWHGAWCWERVIPLLDAATVPVLVVDLPSVSHDNATLHDDADYVRGALDSIDGDAVLLGHSYGVARQAGNVRRLHRRPRASGCVATIERGAHRRVGRLADEPLAVPEPARARRRPARRAQLALTIPATSVNVVTRG